MTDNYYEIKILRLKILYILAGWAVFIGIELFSAFFYLSIYIFLSTVKIGKKMQIPAMF